MTVSKQPLSYSSSSEYYSTNLNRVKLTKLMAVSAVSCLDKFRRYRQALAFDYLQPRVGLIPSKRD